ncbi:Tyrosine recombinase slr0733 [Labeo rohita]|uniref:Tyrosine recombinase slr0733 n=1 Tax=Labeo rohita TaxID=84645 RepID=A0ABQ8LA56_LABRO|nr:Tyrosine recombinase slr0733 [Labeo rohita]
MAYQLPRVVGCASGPSSLPTDVASQARACSHRQHGDCSLHQPSGWSSLPSHVTTRPPSAPMESNVAEIATCRSHSRRTQPCSRPALTAVHPSWRMATPPRDSPADLEPFRGGPDRSVCFPRILPLPAVLLPQRGSQQPRQGRTGTQLASGAQVRLSPSEPPCTDTVQDQGGRGAGSAGCAILAHPDLVSRTHFPRGSPSLENPLEERPSFSGDGHNLAPAPRPVEPARLVPGRDASDLSGLPQAVIETITQSRATSTRQAYALRWGLFADWCSSRGEDPQRCTIAVVLSFLQEKLERRLSPSTLKVYVAAIAAYHDAVDGTSLGKHQLIVRFLRGARRVNPPQAAPHTLLGPLRRPPGSAGGPI